jgi:hypothetical protein
MTVLWNRLVLALNGFKVFPRTTPIHTPEDDFRNPPTTDDGVFGLSHPEFIGCSIGLRTILYRLAITAKLKRRRLQNTL